MDPLFKALLTQTSNLGLQVQTVTVLAFQLLILLLIPIQSLPKIGTYPKPLTGLPPESSYMI